MSHPSPNRVNEKRGRCAWPSLHHDHQGIQGTLFQTSRAIVSFTYIAYVQNKEDTVRDPGRQGQGGGLTRDIPFRSAHGVSHRIRLCGPQLSRNLGFPRTYAQILYIFCRKSLLRIWCKRMAIIDAARTAMRLQIPTLATNIS